MRIRIFASCVVCFTLAVIGAGAQDAPVVKRRAELEKVLEDYAGGNRAPMRGLSGSGCSN